jgi:hypothetical protein
MNGKAPSPFVDGFKGSFKLAAGLVLAVISVLSSFADNSLSLRDISSRSGLKTRDVDRRR